LSTVILDCLQTDYNNPMCRHPMPPNPMSQFPSPVMTIVMLMCMTGMSMGSMCGRARLAVVSVTNSVVGGAGSVVMRSSPRSGGSMAIPSGAGRSVTWTCGILPSPGSRGIFAWSVPIRGARTRLMVVCPVSRSVRHCMCHSTGEHEQC